MTLSEFKAWFEGFTEDIKGAPTEKQWTRIKARIEEIDNSTITQPIIIDRYPTRRPGPFDDGIRYWFDTVFDNNAIIHIGRNEAKLYVE